MKSIFTLLFLILISLPGIRAQMPIWVFEDSLQFGNTQFPGISVTIPEVDYEKTLKEWIKELETSTRSKVVTENSDLLIFGAKIKDITPNTINVYSRLINQDTMLKLVASFELKKDQYIERSTGETELSKAENFLKQFAKNQYIYLVKNQVDAEEKKLRDIEKELSSLENDKSRMQRSIQSNNSSIISEKENLAVQNNELTTVSSALIEHNNQLSTMEAGPAKEEKLDYIKDLEKRKKKALKSIKSSENRINKANNEINKAEGNLPKNDRNQGKVNDMVEQQEAVLQRFTDKLNAIKKY